MDNFNTNTQTNDYKLTDLDLDAPLQNVQISTISGAADLGPVLRSDRIVFGDVALAAHCKDGFGDAIKYITAIHKDMRSIPAYPASMETLEKILERRAQVENLLGELDGAIRKIKEAGLGLSYSLSPIAVVDEGEFGQFGRKGWACALSLKFISQ